MSLGPSSNENSEPRDLARAGTLAGRLLNQEERKNVTILFADIVGSTSMVVDQDPEVALALLRPTLVMASDVVERYGGTVTRDTGDGLVAIFGAPLTEEEHALGGCCAALEMHFALAHSAQGIQLRIGIHSGEVVIHRTRVGPVWNLDAAGETVHLASRLEEAAPAGGTWISDVTFSLARGRVGTLLLGSRTFRGFRTPTVVHLLQTVDASLSRLDVAGRRGLSPFINRDGELPVLESAHARTTDGHGCAVGIAGDAGVGKSRLIREFVAGRGGIAVLEARCTQWRDDSGFHATRALTGRLFGLGANDSPTTVRQRLEMAFGQPGAPPADAFAPIAALHGALADQAAVAWAALLPNARRRRIIEGCVAALLCAAAHKPLLVVIDDLHWADSGTDDVVEQLLDQVHLPRLLLLLGWRSNHQPRWATHPALSRIALSPLSPDYARDLARQVLGDHAGDETAVAELAHRSGGNPFFIEEAAAMPDRLVLPPTVREVLGARLDRLKPAEKHLIEVLATVGEPAAADLLGQLLNGGADGDRPELVAAELERAGLVRIDGVGHSARFACRHSLLQDVAYQGLTRLRRRALHATIAQAMEQLAGDRVGEEAEVLARHARLGEAWRAALRHARAAGARAASHSANRQAVRFYEEALDALKHLPEDADALSMGVDLRFDLRGPLFQLGHINSLRLSLDEAAVLAERLGDARRLGQLYIFQSHYACLAGDYAAAVAAAEHARGVARQHDDPALELRAVFQRSLAQVGFGELDAAIEGMVQVAAQAEDPALGGRFGLDAELAIVALAYQARALADLGRFEAAERVVAACTARARQPFESIFAALAEGYVLLTRGRAVEAIVPLTEAVARCERAEADLMRPVALGFLGAAEAASGAVDAGLPRLEVAVAAAREMGFLFQQPLRLALLAEALLAAGRREDAVRRAEEAVTLARAQRDRVSLTVALRAAAPTAITP